MTRVKAMKHENIVITGMGLISGSGLSVKEFTEKLEHQSFAPVEITRYSLTGINCKYAFEVGEGFSIKNYSKKISVTRKERMSQLTVAACVQAYQDARLDNCDIPDERIGSILTTEYGPTNTVLKYLLQLYEKGPGDVSPNFFTQTVYNVAAGQACIQLSLKGVSSTLVGCSSLQYAWTLLQDDKADIVFAIGVDELCSCVHHRYETNGVILPGNDLDGGNTFTLGEGCGVLVLEKESVARRRNAKIYAEVLAYQRRSSVSMHKEYVEFADDDTVYKNNLEALLVSESMQVNDIQKYYMASNGIPTLIKAENDALDALGFNGERFYPKDRFGECFGADEMLAVIESIVRGKKDEIVAINTLFLNGGAGTCLLATKEGAHV